jgi:hypothetical protein
MDDVVDSANPAPVGNTLTLTVTVPPALTGPGRRRAWSFSPTAATSSVMLRTVGNM